MTFIDAYIENRLDARHLPTKDVDWSLGESGKPKVSYFGRFDDVMILKASARLMQGQYDNPARRQSVSQSLTEELASAIENGTSVLVVRDTDGSQGFLPDTKAITTIKEHAALEYLCELLALEAMDYMKDIVQEIQQIQEAGLQDKVYADEDEILNAVRLVAAEFDGAR
ncbi:hypothetical protein [Alteromonas macleodii]|uniref:hypothetical protein n=1 Tax=Alteromonas macleodii TaxID=28108 RepID=UPI0031403074|tara:strand:- start:17213 stop:17719 length:507 start_codon:yes stop_codon:yes gene_type:complete